MFFTNNTELNINKYISHQWNHMQGFIDHLHQEREHFLQGIGFFCQEKENSAMRMQGLHLLLINNCPYAIEGSAVNHQAGSIGSEEILKFHSIYQFNDEILRTVAFESRRYSYNASHFNFLEAQLPIDIKLYQYESEDKIVISKHGAGNIDMYASYSLSQDSLLTVKTSESIIKNAKHIAMIKLINERFDQIKKN